MRRRALMGYIGPQIMGDGQLIAGQDDLDFLLSGDTENNYPQNVTDEAKARILARNGVLMRDRPPTQARLFPLGFGSDGPVAAGDTVLIQTRPQVIFRGELVVVPSDIAGDFTIDDIKIGKDSQLVADAPLPARCLQEDSVNVVMQLDTAQIGIDITLAVTNIGGAPRTFRALMMGKAVE